MTTESKSARVCVRLPAALAARTDYAVNNAETPPFNRSKAVAAALEAWLPAREQEIEKRLGTSGKKAR